MSNYWEEKFAETGADGVDFVPLTAKPWDIKIVYDSKTKEEILAGAAYPRSNYFFWKLVNGKKVYITEEGDKRTPGKIPVHFERTPIFMIIDTYAEAEPIIVVKDRATAEELCMSLTEEAAHAKAYDLYCHMHHWSMERAVKEAWRICTLDYLIYETSIVEFTPF
jgi:hypothetical protein